MDLKKRFTEFLFGIKNLDKLDEDFNYPYSEDKEEKRQQIWSNLQKGILFEDNLTFIPWKTSFNRLNKYKVKINDSGNFTKLYFGERTILDGYKCNAQALKWKWSFWANPIQEISENIGINEDGEAKFHELREYLTNLLGDPFKTEIEKWGNIDLGEVMWVNGEVRISIVGFEMHSACYNLEIGLIRNENQKNWW